MLQLTLYTSLKLCGRTTELPPSDFIQVCLRATQSRLYHLGIRGKVSRNTLAHANQTRDWRIYADFAQILIEKARNFTPPILSASNWLNPLCPGSLILPKRASS